MGRERERERNINVWLPLTHPPMGTWPAAQACALTGNPTIDPFVLRPAFNSLSHRALVFIFTYDFREREGERDRNIDLFFHPFLLSLVDSWCALTGDQTHNLGVLGQRSNQLSHPVRAPHSFIFNWGKIHKTCNDSFFKIFYLFIFRQRGREKERERNINVWLLLAHPPLGTRPTTQACVLTGNQTGKPLACRPALYPLSHTKAHFKVQHSVHSQWQFLFLVPEHPISPEGYPVPLKQLLPFPPSTFFFF